ncbi:hypothetical protein [Pseudomonas asiatica]|uniref:hypothetical protein n=1 Tax=Pseudomonas asiatica TaxID=2219225 RepID=UPI003878209D
MPAARKVNIDPDRVPSLVMTRDEVLYKLRQALAPVRITDYILNNWMARDYFPRPVALGGLRSHGKAMHVVWLTADVQAFLDGLPSQPRLKAPKNYGGTPKKRTEDQPA